jgi:transcription initiation factor TFIIB
MYRLRKWQRRIRVSDAAERNLVFALGEIDRMASQLALPKSVKEAAALTYRKAIERKMIRGRSIEGMAAAALYAACQECKIPRTLDEVAKASRVNKTEVDRNCRFITRKLSIHLAPTDIADYIPKIASELKLDGKTQAAAFRLVERCERKKLAQTCNPVAVAAAAVYVAHLLHAEELTKGERKILRFLVDAAKLTDIKKAAGAPDETVQDTLAKLVEREFVAEANGVYHRTDKAEAILRKVTQDDIANVVNLTEVTVRNMAKRICNGLGIRLLNRPSVKAGQKQQKERVPLGVQNIVVSVTWDGVEFNLKELAEKLKEDEEFWDVSYDKKEFPGMVLKLKPQVSFLLFESGKANCVGAKRVEDAREAIATLTRKLRRAGLKVPKPHIAVRNIVMTFDLGREVDIDKIARTFEGAEYNPESFPGMTLKLDKPKATILLFASGRGVCAGARSVAGAKRAIERVGPLVTR